MNEELFSPEIYDVKGASMGADTLLEDAGLFPSTKEEEDSLDFGKPLLNLSREELLSTVKRDTSINQKPEDICDVENGKKEKAMLQMESTEIQAKTKTKKKIKMKGVQKRRVSKKYHESEGMEALTLGLELPDSSESSNHLHEEGSESESVSDFDIEQKDTIENHDDMEDVEEGEIVLHDPSAIESMESEFPFIGKPIPMDAVSMDFTKSDMVHDRRNMRHIPQFLLDEIDYNIVQANQLIYACSKLTRAEFNVLMACIAMIKKEDKDFEWISFQTKDLMRFCGLNEDNPIRDGKKIVRGLMNKTFAIWQKNKDGEIGVAEYSWLYGIYYNRSKIEIRLHDKLKPFLLNLQKDFTSEKFKIISSYSKKYSAKIHLLLHSVFSRKSSRMSYERKIEYEAKESYDINTIRQMLTGEEDLYARFNSFMAKVLIPSIKEINDFGYYRLEVAPFSTGNHGSSYDRLIFKFGLGNQGIERLRERNEANKNGEGLNYGEDLLNGNDAELLLLMKENPENGVFLKDTSFSLEDRMRKNPQYERAMKVILNLRFSEGELHFLEHIQEEIIICAISDLKEKRYEIQEKDWKNHILSYVLARKRKMDEAEKNGREETVKDALDAFF